MLYENFIRKRLYAYVLTPDEKDNIYSFSYKLAIEIKDKYDDDCYIHYLKGVRPVAKISFIRTIKRVYDKMQKELNEFVKKHRL